MNILRCPACGRALYPVSFGEITLDACEGGCGGVWFDRSELKAGVWPRTGAEPKPVHMQWDPQVTVDPARPRECPRCRPTRMERHGFAGDARIQVDECPKCGGIWLDRGEAEAAQGRERSEGEASPSADAASPSALTRFARRLRYHPRGARSAAASAAGPAGWAERNSPPASSGSYWARWGGGFVIPLLVGLCGLRICLVQHASIQGHPAAATLFVSTLAAIGKGMAIISAALFLHFRFLWGSSERLCRFSAFGKAASILLLLLSVCAFLGGIISR